MKLSLENDVWFKAKKSLLQKHRQLNLSMLEASDLMEATEAGLCLVREGSGWRQQSQDLGRAEDRTDRKLSPPFCTLEPTKCSFSLWGFREQAVHV